MMPRAWTAKDERQYEHIKDSARKEGRSSGRAKQIAAATVNKHRAEEGRTKTSASKSAGGGAKKAKKRTAKTSKTSKTRKTAKTARRSGSTKTARASKKTGRATRATKRTSRR
jgi:hypothetical protein